MTAAPAAATPATESTQAVVPQARRRRHQVQKTAAHESSCRDIATVHFAANVSELSPEQAAVLRQGFDRAGELTGKIEVFAYCDDIGAAKWNAILSQRRANAVAKAVASIQPDLALETKGFGSADPVVPNRSWKARAQNRRAEVRVCPANAGK